MVIDSMRISRRQFLLQVSASALCMAVPLAAQSSVNAHTACLLAAWQLPDGTYQVGVLNTLYGQPRAVQLLDYSIELAIDLPTRPHGLMHMHGDEYLVIARRPGDWMMRLNVRTRETERIWQDEDRHLNGHSAQHGEFLYTTETNVLDSTGALAVRDCRTLELLEVWATHGRDPHEMLVLPNGGLGIDEPFLLVANGGIPTHADMGRTQLNHLPMDSSVVAMHPISGKVLKHWTLNDSRLSLRHMAVHASGVVGIAMQAHHLDEAQKHAAPVLALLDQHGLRAAAGSAGVNGYAGDIVTTPDGFVVSCTKNDSALKFNPAGNLVDVIKAKAACALASNGKQVWLGHQSTGHANSLELDNHWLLV